MIVRTKSNAKKLFYEMVDKFVEFTSYYPLSPFCKWIEGKDVKAYQTPDNNRCHWVAYMGKRNKNRLRIVPCIAFQEGRSPVVHFINYDPKKDRYIDNSYGSKSVLKKYCVFSDEWIEKKFKKNDGVLDMDDILVIVKKDLFDHIVLPGHWISRKLDPMEVW